MIYIDIYYKDDRKWGIENIIQICSFFQRDYSLSLPHCVPLSLSLFLSMKI